MRLGGGKCSHLSVSLRDAAVPSFLRVLIYEPGDMLSQEELPESLLPKCLDVLRKLSASERDLIRVGVEIVHELRDPKDEDEEEDLNVSIFSMRMGTTSLSCLIIRKMPTPKQASGIHQ
jgi:hypothetical protein